MQTSLRRWRLGLALLFALALALRLALFVAWQTDDLLRFQSGDYTLYRIAADHIDQVGDFSSSVFIVRPPVFPLVIWGLGLNDHGVLLLNAMLGALIAPLTPLLARRLGLSDVLALAAGSLVAIDPAGVVYSTFLGPESLANLTLLAAVVALLTGVTTLPPGKRALGWGVLAGVALALSFLARPAPYLLWIVLGGWLLLTNPRYWRVLAIFALICMVSVGLWIGHNSATFDHATFSTIGPYTVVYYHAASVEHLATSQTMDAIYTSINRRVEQYAGFERDPAAIGPEARHRYLAASPEVASALNRVAVEIFADYPLITLATFPIGFVRMYGMATVAFDDAPLWVKTLEVLWNSALVIGTALGLWWALRRRAYRLFWGVLLPVAYFTAGTLLVKSAGMSPRERSMLTPFMAVAVIYALSVLFERRRQGVVAGRDEVLDADLDVVRGE